MDVVSPDPLPDATDPASVIKPPAEEANVPDEFADLNYNLDAQIQALSSTASPAQYLQLQYHPNFHRKDDIIPLDIALPLEDCPAHIQPLLAHEGYERPWRPMTTCAEFEIVELMTIRRLNDNDINKFLKGVHSKQCTDGQLHTKGYQPAYVWHSGSANIAIQDAKDYHAMMAQACEYTLKWNVNEIPVDVPGLDHRLKLHWREPLDFIRDLITDKSLVPYLHFMPVKKYLIVGDAEYKVYNEPWTGLSWWHIQEQLLPVIGDVEHCFLPLHLWLDKGQVTWRVQMHPVVLRPAWLPAEICNGSGNGGGILIAMMPMMNLPDDTSDKNAPTKDAIACAKAKVYQETLHIIFGKTQDASHNGMILECGDGVLRRFYPDMLIELLDGKEAATFCATRGANANFPCTKCLVPQSELWKIPADYPLRTSEAMQEVHTNAQKISGKGEREEYLRERGIHNVELFGWGWRLLDPYMSWRYDKLHIDNMGKGGKHIWPYTLNKFEAKKIMNKVNHVMT